MWEHEKEEEEEEEEEEVRRSFECCLLVEGVAPLHACVRHWVLSTALLCSPCCCSVSTSATLDAAGDADSRHTFAKS